MHGFNISRHYERGLETFIIYILFSLEGQAVSHSANQRRLTAAGSGGPPINTPSVSANEGHSGCSVLPKRVSAHTPTHTLIPFMCECVFLCLDINVGCTPEG